jgi:hypothetical protein
MAKRFLIASNPLPLDFCLCRFLIEAPFRLIHICGSPHGLTAASLSNFSPGGVRKSNKCIGEFSSWELNKLGFGEVECKGSLQFFWKQLIGAA